MRQEEPILDLQFGGKHLTLLGTAHVSQASVDKVRELLGLDRFDAVAVELCASRYKIITDPDSLAKMDMFQVLKEGKTPMVIANLVLSAFQQKIAEDLGIEPGAEMKTAINIAKANNISHLLVDREIGITLKRCYRSIPWWQRLYLMAGLLGSVLSFEKVEEQEIEKLKEGDIMEAAFAHFAATHPGVYKPLIEERDRYMALRLCQEINNVDYQQILAVVGAGHLKGMRQQLEKHADSTPQYLEAELTKLNETPKGRGWSKLIPWIIVVIILIGFAFGFSRDTELGWEMVADWVFINGGLSAFGAMIALAHPLTVITAFLAAPLTSLNPAIGAGMVTAAMELWLRKPSVGDFSKLRKDATRLKGWWKNRVARILLVFFMSTLGSALGTYIAGFRIFEKLT